MGRYEKKTCLQCKIETILNFLVLQTSVLSHISKIPFVENLVLVVLKKKNLVLQLLRYAPHLQLVVIGFGLVRLL